MIRAIVLTSNEEKHLERCLQSVKTFVDEVYIIDCFSSDKTEKIALQFNSKVLKNKWLNYATQFNWGLSQLPPNTKWVLRIDADEYITPELAEEIKEKIKTISEDVDGIFCSRRMTFQGKLIKYGGVFPVRVMRLFRYGRGQCENRWMDEHIKVSGPTADFVGEMIDDNLNSLTWWTEKHNKYASREAVDLLNLEFGFIPHDSVANLKTRTQAGIKRWLKEVVYAKIPTGFRALLYFIYRYIIRLGFLDGSSGTAFHFLQGFWYRYLVDAKILEVKRYMKQENVSITVAIEKVLDIKL